MPTEFTPLVSLAGGLLIGLAAVVLMAVHGRIAGITGILAGTLPPNRPSAWRLAFLKGMIFAPLLLCLSGMVVPVTPVASLPVTIAGGLLVGIGASFGNGCPSGHGICGIARLSKRSIVATLVFMATAFITVFVTHHVIGS